MSEIAQRLSYEDLLYQLAEEASELSHAALKLARCIKGSNTTPVSASDARNNLIEEYSDVVQVARELLLAPNEKQIAAKEKRWIDRLMSKKLKPCPKCGSTEIVGRVCGGAAYGCGEYEYEVECPCGVLFTTSHIFETAEEAKELGIAEWNARAERTCNMTIVESPKTARPCDDQQQDAVSSPSHYASGDIECKDAMKAALGGANGLPAMAFYWWGCAFKYLWRWRYKNGVQDLRKCEQCIDFLIGEVESKAETS